jgi:hypothetical protein
LKVDFGLAPGLIPGLNELARLVLAAGAGVQAINATPNWPDACFQTTVHPIARMPSQAPLITEWENGCPLWGLFVR